MVNRKEINDEIKKNEKGLNERQLKLFREKSQQIWFRQYASKSNEHLKEIVKTIKKQSKKYQGEYWNKKGVAEDKRGEFKRPTPKGVKKKAVKKEVKKQVAKKLSRKDREIVKQNYRIAPSGRRYSKTEIHEGLGSKRAKEYRIKNDIPVNDYN